MSPLEKPVILDNDVISRLFSSGALGRALEVWPRGSFRVTEQVRDEARQWPAKGKELVAILERLEAKDIISFVSINESSEDEIQAYARLMLVSKLGRGESASIAIASQRGFCVATDDSIARDTCKDMYPSVLLLGTGDLLNTAVRDGLMTRVEADSIQAKIRHLGNK